MTAANLDLEVTNSPELSDRARLPADQRSGATNTAQSVSTADEPAPTWSAPIAGAVVGATIGAVGGAIWSIGAAVGFLPALASCNLAGIASSIAAGVAMFGAAGALIDWGMPDDARLCDRERDEAAGPTVAPAVVCYRPADRMIDPGAALWKRTTRDTGAIPSRLFPW